MERLLPALSGCIQAKSIRVPTLKVSAIDLAPDFRQDATLETIHQIPERAAATGPRLANLFIWFDNGWGFASRMVDVAHHWLALNLPK